MAADDTGVENKKYIDAATQTEDMEPIKSSTPKKTLKNFVTSVSSFSAGDSFIDDSKDVDYSSDETLISLGEQEKGEITSEENVIKSSKYVVFETMLDELIRLVRCPFCGSPVISNKKSGLGTSIHCKLRCENDHLVCDWKSQPLLGKLPAFNLLLSSAIVFSGKCKDAQQVKTTVKP